MKKIIIAVAVAAVLVGGSIAGYQLIAPDQVTMKGAVTTPWDVFEATDAFTDPLPEFGDRCAPGTTTVEKGTQVIVKNGDGQTVGAGKLKHGKIRRHPHSAALVNASCALPFLVTVELDGSSFYTLHVAGYELAVSEAEIQKPVTLSAGT